ncbi:MAG: RHS repeat-associated core domain-containing protein [Clostridia bacterium]|nr:RHS repeat-associated core domain-containing protein [Clostridia bacterium]
MINKFEGGLLQECLAIIDGEVNFGDGTDSETLLPSHYYDNKENYITNTCGVKNQQQVSLQTGLLKVTHHLHQGSGSRLPFSLSLSYNPEFCTRDYLWDYKNIMPAKGWKFNYQQAIRLNDEYAYYYDGDFNVHKLTKLGNKYYESGKKTGLILTVIRSDNAITSYQLTDGSNTKLHFNEHGNLSSITKTISNTTITTTLEYNSNHKLTKVTDGLGKEYTFTYTTTGIIVKDQAQETICSLSISNKYLQSISGIDNSNQYTLTYLNERIETIIDQLRQVKSAILYDDLYRVNKITNYTFTVNDDDSIAEQTLNIAQLSYGNKKTIITQKQSESVDEEGTSAYYYFAENGELIYVSDKQEDSLENATFENSKAFKASDVYADLKEENGITTTQEEYEVISLDTGGTSHSQALGESTPQTWYETEDVNFDIQYTASENTTTLSNVKFTLADYNQTMLSKFKNSTGFNLWYNDGENLITGCSNLLIKVTGATEFTALDQIKYATLTIQDNLKNFSYISNVTSSRLTISDYLHVTIDENQEDYRVAKSVYNTDLQLLNETNYQGIKNTYTYGIYGDCLKIETNKEGSTDVSTKLISEMAYTDGKMTRETGYYNLERPTVNYEYDKYGNLTKVTDAKGNAYNYAFLTDGETLNSVFAGGLYNEMLYNQGCIQNIYTAGPTQDLSQERYTFNYNDKRELESVRPSNIPADNTTLLKVPAIFKSQPKIEPNSVITEDIDEIYAIEKHYDNCSRLRKIIKVCKSNHDYDTPLMYYYYWDDGGFDKGIFNNPNITEEKIIDILLLKNCTVDPLDSRITATKKAKLRVIVDKTDINNYNSYGALYVNGELKKIIYPDLIFESSIEERDCIGRPTSTKIARLDDDPVLTVTNNVEYSDYFSNKIKSESAVIYDTYNENTTTTVNTTYTYDGINRATEVTVSSGGIDRRTEYSFAPAKKLNKLPSLDGPVSLQPGGTTSTTSVVGSTNLISQITETGYGSTVTTQIEYDSNGNITKYGNTTYVYDSLNRLVRENNYDLDKTIIYEYDNSGNLFRRKEYAYTTGTISSDPTASTVFIGGNWVDQVKTVRNLLTNEDKAFEYDDSGRMTTRGDGRTFVWNSNGTLAQIMVDDNTYNSYQYDTNNYMAGCSELTPHYRQYRYIDGKLVVYAYFNREYHSNKTTFFVKATEFIYNSTGVIGFYDNKKLYTYRKNLFGDITEIYDGSTCVAKYAYDAWGNCTILQNNDDDIANVNPFRYRSYFYDNISGLYYLKSRYYDPTIGRFISPDGVEYLEPDNVLGLNLYAYCANNPVMYVDPSGHSWEWSTFGQALGYLVTGIGAIVSGVLVVTSGVATLPMLLVAGITIGAGVLTAVNGVAEAGGLAFNYNFMEDGLFGGNTTAYNTYASITGSVATVGSIVCGTWYKYNTPRIQAYKNIGSAEFPGNYYADEIASRPYFDSVLTQKNIIKYGKMSKTIGKNGKLFYSFTAKGSSLINGVFNEGIYELTLTSDYKLIWHLLFKGG